MVKIKKSVGGVQLGTILLDAKIFLDLFLLKTLPMKCVC